VNRERELAVSKERISNPGFLVILTGGTAVGKTELKERLAGKYSDIRFLVTTTTREPRLEKGERDGVDYHFIKRDKFAEMIDNNEFVEFASHSQRVRSQRRSMGNVGNLEERLLEDKILMEQYGTLFDIRIRNDEDKIEESLESLENLILKSFKDTKITF
jgi:hypothetical protein